MSSNSLSRRAKPLAPGTLGAIITASLASGAATLTVALAMGWLTVARNAVGREEAIELIATNAPYTREREALQNNVSLNARSIDELSDRLREMEQQGHRVEAKLDLLLSEFVRRELPTTKDE